MRWAETSRAITLLLDVCLPYAALKALSADTPSVVSGASATIVSDALMNPFDGKYLSMFHKMNFLTIYSYQATHASTWVAS